ncbi:hypothetical protein ACFLRI_04945 [Bacteroidota bacterium]
MASRLPTLFKLPGYTIFEYRPRFYNADKDKMEERKRKLKFKEHAFQRDSALVGQFKRERVDIRRKSILISNIIRIVLIILFCALCYYLAVSLGLLWKMM